MSFHLIFFELNAKNKTSHTYIALRNTFVRRRDITFVESVHELDCLDSGRHGVAARRNINRQPGAEADKDVSQDDDSQV